MEVGVDAEAAAGMAPSSDVSRPLRMSERGSWPSDLLFALCDRREPDCDGVDALSALLRRAMDPNPKVRILFVVADAPVSLSPFLPSFLWEENAGDAAGYVTGLGWRTMPSGGGGPGSEMTLRRRAERREADEEEDCGEWSIE